MPAHPQRSAGHARHTGRVRLSKRSAVLALLAACATAAGCTTPIDGQARDDGTVIKRSDGDRGGIDPSFVRGTDGGSADRLAATVINDVSDYWRQTFPKIFGKQWRELRGGYYSVDTADQRAPAPPCTDQASDVEGNAFYCPGKDVMAWDRAALLPVLTERFGEAAVLLVLAHEMGHAAQRQSGLTTRVENANPERYPTIVIEAMADCYAGAAVRWITDGKSKHLRISSRQLDSALGALITFRDPIGTSQSDESSHGDAFDRVSAFQDGYREGPKLCAGIDARTRSFTQREFMNMDDQARGGNLPFGELTRSLRRDAVGYFARVVSDGGRQWQPPEVRMRPNPARCTSGDQGPVAFCPRANAVQLANTGPLRELHTSIGDYATGTLLASRYGLSALKALGKPIRGPSASRGALCLAGAYTATLLRRTYGFALSPGDLDEAVQLLLAHDYPARDAAGRGIGTGFERVATFRTGVTHGPSACTRG
ncbi:MAG: metalloprotease-like protein [Pseudonocardiaceae bacterium]|nr:metalloprotease-like protein [Pseudonocardiaceae bacterium]